MNTALLYLCLSWVTCNYRQNCWDYPQMGYFGKQDIWTSPLPPPFQVVSGVCCLLLVAGSWYRGLTVLGGGWGKERFIPPSPSPSNACHAGYFLSAKRHKGSLWQSVLTILSPVVACKLALRLEIARVVIARRLAVTKVFYRFVDPWDLFLLFEVWYAVYWSC